MNTKDIILERLGKEKLGKKVARLIGYDEDGTKVHDYVGDEIALEIMRYDNTKDFVLGRYDNATRQYKIAFDPNMKGGPIKSIVNAYSSL